MKIFFRGILLMVFVALLFAPSVKATHVSGGNITYKCLGGDTFEISLTLYRDCSGASAPSSPISLPITNSCGFTTPTSVDLYLQDPVTGNVCPGSAQSCATEVSQICAPELPNTYCGSGSNLYPGMEEYVYTGIVVLPPCASWNFSYNLCCRNSTTNVDGQPSFYVESMVNTLDGNCHSPEFFAQPIPYVCLNQPFNYSFGVSELDGDSLVFSLVSAQTSGIPVTYTAPYSAAQPIIGISIDSVTGQLTFTPTTQGIFIIAVMVEEYDEFGNLLGYVIRDIQVVVQSCTNGVPSDTSGVITNLTGDADTLGPYALALCEGNSFCFNAVFTDADSLDSLSIVTNLQSVLSGATLTIDSGYNPLYITICWTAPPGSSGMNTAFSLTVDDNACPIPGQQTFVYDIQVSQSTVAWPENTVLCGDQEAELFVSGGDSVVWTAISGDSIVVGVNFSCDTCFSTIAKPDTTTMYEVVSNMSTTCVNRDTVTVTVVPDFTLIVTGADTLCDYDTIPLNADASPGTFDYTYQWNNSATLSDDTIPNPMAWPPVTTDYIATVTSDTGCVKSDTVHVLVFPPPNITLLPGDSSICDGDSIQFDITGDPLGGFEINWNNGTTLNDPTIANPMALPVDTIEYIVALTDTNSGCIVYRSQTISTVPNYTYALTNDTVFCAPFDSVELSVAPDPPASYYTYSWEANAPYVQLTAPAADTTYALSAASHTYFVTVDAGNGCVKNDSVVILINEPLSLEILPGDTLLCDSTSLQLTAEAAALRDNFDPGIDYAMWYNISGGEADTACGSVSGSNGLYFNSSFNRYAETHDICMINGGVVEFYLKMPQTTGPPCDINETGDEVVLEYSLDEGANWVNINTYGILSYPFLTLIQENIPPQSSSIRFRWRQLNNNGPGFDNWMLDDVKIVADPGCYSYTWSPAAGLSDPNIYNPVASIDSSITYIVTATNNITGCTFIDTMDIIAVPKFSYSISQTETLVCLQGSAQYSVSTGAPTYLYNWSPPDFLNNDTIPNPVATFTSPGNQTHYVTITDVSGCALRDSVTVEVLPDYPPNIEISTSLDSLCNIGGDTAQLNAEFSGAPNGCGLIPSGCVNPVSTYEVGGGTQTGVGPSPFVGQANGARYQFLYRAADIDTTGLSGGRITQMALRLGAVASNQPYQSFTIKMSCTSTSSFPSSNPQFETGLYTVYGPVQVTPSAYSWNTFVLDNAYDWDGVSNLLLEICYDNWSGSNNDEVYYTNTPYNSVISQSTNNNTTAGCDLSTPVSSPSVQVPNIRLTACPVTFNSNDYSYSWSPGTGLSDPNIKDPEAYSLTPTTYTVTVTHDVGGCTGTASILIDTLGPIIASIEPSGPLCIDQGTETLIAQPQGGTWSGPGIINASNGIFDPVTAGDGTHTIYYTISGICGDMDSTNIVVIDNDPTITPAGPYCINDQSVTLIAAQEGGVWAGSGITDTVNGMFSPQAVGATDTVMITYYIGGDCPVSDTIEIIINPAPPQPTISGNPAALCIDDPAVALSVNVPNGAWAGISSDSTFNPAVAGAGSHNVTYTVTNVYQCSRSDQVSIVVHPLPEIIISPQSFCDAESSATLAVDPAGGIWDAVPGINPDGTFSPSAMGDTTFSVYYFYTDENGCSDSLAGNFIVYKTPAPPEGTKDSVCEGSPMSLSVLSGGNGSFTWYANEGLTDTVAIGSSVQFPAELSSVMLYLTETENGCQSEAFLIENQVFPLPEMGFSATPEAGDVALEVQFNNTTTPEAAEFFWDFDYYGATSKNSSPSHTYEEPGIYQVMLIAVSENDCRDTIFKTIVVNDVLWLDIPNVFTPNDDGLNDAFRLINYNGVVTFNVMIFNRWGLKVAEYNAPDFLWTGEGHKDGIYYWVINASGPDGETREYTGHVTMIGSIR